MNSTENHDKAKLGTLQSVFDNTDGMISFQEAMCLYELASRVRNGCILEIGSYRGRSTVFLGKGSLDGANVPVFAIDPHASFTGVLGGTFGPRDRAIFYRTMLNNDCNEIVSLINLSSEFFSERWKSPVSLLWIDGDHSYEGVLRDFCCWEPHLLPDAFIAFDDALDSNLGPFRLIEELTRTARYQKFECVGKVVVLRRC